MFVLIIVSISEISHHISSRHLNIDELAKLFAHLVHYKLVFLDIKASTLLLNIIWEEYIFWPAVILARLRTVQIFYSTPTMKWRHLLHTDIF